MTIVKKPLPLEFFVDQIRSRKNFSFTRYGDGEAACIMGESGANCDGHEYTPGLRTALSDTLVFPGDYYHGLLSIALRNKPDFKEFIEATFVEWYEGDSLLNASCAGRLLPFIQALRSTVVAYVGPIRLKGLSTYFPIDNFIRVPEKNAFEKHLQIEVALTNYIRSNPVPPHVILFSCGMPTKVIVHNIWKEFGDEVTMIDVGSMFDIYMGYVTRSYAKRYDWRKLISKNTGM